MLVDALVILLSLIVFKTINLALYGILALFVASFSINLLISKLNVSKLAFVVTDKGRRYRNSWYRIPPEASRLSNPWARTLWRKTKCCCAR